MRRFYVVILLLFLLTVVGTVGLRIITHGSWVDCFYLAVITLSTVGFSEVLPLGPEGRLFIVFYLIFGFGVFTYSASQLGHWIVNAQMRKVIARRRMQNQIARLKNHFVICGAGRMGQVIADYLDRKQRPFVLVDIDDDVLDPLSQERGWLCLVGDATNDKTLIEAGIERATSLATVLPTDADNVYVTLSARMLAANVQIVARAAEEKAIQKIERAGATRVISPLSTGAIKMARFMLAPRVEDFLEIADDHGHELELADVQITKDSPYAGKKLSNTDLREKGVMVLGIRRADGSRLMPPPGSATIEAGDWLFAFGDAEAVNRLTGGGH